MCHAYGYAVRVWVCDAYAMHVPCICHLQADDKQVEFQFDEDLCFNIPFKPTVTVTGRCVLTRDPVTGLIVQYREFWDKSPADVVKTAFNRPKA